LTAKPNSLLIVHWKDTYATKQGGQRLNVTAGSSFKYALNLWFSCLKESMHFCTCLAYLRLIEPIGAFENMA
jgi:hypothetical protein